MSFVYSTVHSSKEKSVDFTNSSHDGSRWMINPLSSFVLLLFLICEYLWRGTSVFIRENESKADKPTKMSDSSRKVDTNKGNWGHVRVALGCVCIFLAEMARRLVDLTCPVMCPPRLCLSVPHDLRESQQSYRHPASVIECWFSVTLKFLILGVKKKKPIICGFIFIFLYMPHVSVHGSFRSSCALWHLFGIKAPQLQIYEARQPLFWKITYLHIWK